MKEKIEKLLDILVIVAVFTMVVSILAIFVMVVHIFMQYHGI